MACLPFVLEMLPNQVPLTRMQLRRWAPKDTLCIFADGFGAGGDPWIDLARGQICVDHHSPTIPRRALKASCQQLHQLIQDGAIDSMSERFERIALYLNDVDPDCLMCHFLLENMVLTRGIINPGLNRLVALVSRLDENSGAVGYPGDLKILEIINWLFAPYWEARFDGSLDRKETNTYRSIAEAVNGRIYNYVVTGEAGKIPVNDGFDVLHREGKLAVVVERGPQTIMGVMRAGIEAYVAYRLRPNGATATCSVKRCNPAANFDNYAYYKLCNDLENCGVDRWGGSDDTGGGPRVIGTRLKPDSLMKLMKKCPLY